MKAILRQSRISPKKANLVAALVRNKKVQDALDILKFTPKKTAPILAKLIASAAANAEHNFDQAKESLYIKEIIVTEGPTYKRNVPVSKGRAHPILKRTSHITVKVESSADAKPAKAKKEVEKVEEEVKEVKKTEVKTEKAEKKPTKSEPTK